MITIINAKDYTEEILHPPDISKNKSENDMKKNVEKTSINVIIISEYKQVPS